MRPCVIFNPAAKGNKARRFRAQLDRIAPEVAFKFTAGPNDARRLAAEAVHEGFDTVVAAGGDGTLNEVLNGLADVPVGLQRVRLGFIPLGTMNVFARELGIPLRVADAWQVMLQGREMSVDLPWMECQVEGRPVRRYFAQMAGAGLDARAVELVDWQWKKRVGPLAYVMAGLRALSERAGRIVVEGDGGRIEGELVLLGNGRLYGGSLRIFPAASARDGQLEVCAFPRVHWGMLMTVMPRLLLSGHLPEPRVRRLRAARLRLTSDMRVPVEVDGELAGVLPATVGVVPGGLRVLVPAR